MDGTTSTNNKQDVVELLNTHFARIGEQTANITSPNGNQSNTDFLAFLSPVSDKAIFVFTRMSTRTYKRHPNTEKMVPRQEQMDPRLTYLNK